MSIASPFSDLRLPLMCAPMSFASSVALTVACCASGIIGGWQGGTYTPLDEFEAYLTALSATNGAPPIVNLPARIASEATGAAKLDLLEAHRIPLVLSSIGDPGLLVDRVHGWGGKVIHDVTTMRHAEKALAAGADGLMLTCAGAGGHTGFLTPFAFVPAVRRNFDGLIIVAGGIADGTGIGAVLALGADLACMGTRFIATPESGVFDGHRTMITSSGIDDVVISAAMNGVPANWLRRSLEDAGLDAATIAGPRARMPVDTQAWRDIWSAGQSVALIDEVTPVAVLIDRLGEEFARAGPHRDWRNRLTKLFN